MSALKIKNETGLTLDGGTITVTEGDLYLGETMLETTKPNEIKYLRFAIELGCNISQGKNIFFIFLKFIFSNIQK